MRNILIIGLSIIILLAQGTCFSVRVQAQNASKTINNNNERTLNTINDNAALLKTSVETNVLAFPGAEGFGAETTGGRGGEVIEVTNLNDSGTGSLRAAVERFGVRTVVFRVSGTIVLHSTLSIKNSNITIAGQTAPGDGITLSGFTLKVDADNVIIRYIRSRLGDQQGSQDDAMNGRNKKNIIIDHCTMGWSVDECASFYDNENFTLQYCILSEALYNSIHDKGQHSYGGIWGGQGASFHHNLFAHNVSRNPRFCGTRYSNKPETELVDFRNNVLFNWGKNSIYAAEGGSYNLINNYYKAGPGTSSSVKTRIIAPNADDGSNNQPAGVWGVFYVNGNLVTASEAVTEHNWGGVHASISDVSSIKSETEFACDSVTTHSAEMAFEHVLAQAGVVLPNRDVIDRRIVNEAIAGVPTYGASFGLLKGIIDTQEDVGSWPALKSTTPPVDSDHDGMPDDWETDNGLDPNNADDRNDDKNGNGYTNLEDYLNGLVAAYTYIVRPINFQLLEVNNDKISLSWENVEESTSGYLLERALDDEAFEQIERLPADKTTYNDVVTSSGKYTYRLRSINASDTSLYTESIMAEVTITSVFDNTLPDYIKVFPNPFENSIKVSFNALALQPDKIELINLLGKKVAGCSSISNGETTINTAELPSGLYFVVISSSNKMFTQKLIK